MPRSFLVKKKGDRIFRSYRSDCSDILRVVGVRGESDVVSASEGGYSDQDGGRLSLQSAAAGVWPLIGGDEVKVGSDVIRDAASDLFIPLPGLVQPLTVRVKNSNGYVFDSAPFLFPRRFPLDGSPFYPGDCCGAEVIQPIDLLSHPRGVPVADRSKVVHRELNSISTEALTATVQQQLKTLECCTTTVSTTNHHHISIINSISHSSSSSIGPISPHSSISCSDFSPKSAAQRSETSSSSNSNHSAGGGSSGGGGSRRCNSFQDGITVGYTYDAFFVSDGRSRRRNALGLTTGGGPIAAAAAAAVAAVAVEPAAARQRYKCSECGKHYATSSNLSRHKQTHRSLDSQQAKQCPHCHKVYVSMPALSMHILTHDLKYQCTVCAKAFSRPWLLQGHLRSHTGEKPFGCAHCGKAFADRSNLRAHMQTHSSFKLYTCKRCNKSFALKAYLNKHLESACFKDSEEGEGEEGEIGMEEEDDCSSETSIWSV